MHLKWNLIKILKNFGLLWFQMIIFFNFFALCYLHLHLLVFVEFVKTHIQEIIVFPFDRFNIPIYVLLALLVKINFNIFFS
jgi:hypothetical protein